jgi:asparagine synthase (glutamine-hydrolysing)
MCGIAGNLRFPRADAELVRRMTAALSHRGPDGDGFLAEGPVALGHRRLSIIDVEGGAQPVFNEDRSVAVVLNGEIYNYRELAAELAPRHTFRTRSDTEVMVHLYEEDGEDFVHKLRGMFAFALWDSGAQKLVCARDRYGEKPFLYSAGRDGFTFASELQAFRKGGVPVGKVDRRALSDYLELLYVPAPRTMWTGVRKLPAGHLLVADERGVRVRRYWETPVPGSRARVEPGAPGELRRRLEEAVHLQLRSDVPLAALLSGGIDSSTIVALMARELGPGVKTFSVGFGREDDELPFAREVAERCRTDHHEILVTDDAVRQTVEALGAYSEPFGDSSAVPTVAVCREVAREVKVVLTGDGGDELFAGYAKYRSLAALPHVAGVGGLEALWVDGVPRARALRRATHAVEAMGGRKQRALIEVFSWREREALLGAAAGTAVCFDLPDPVDSALAFDLGVYLPDDLLVKVDIAAMRWGLESRAPFLDPPVGEHAVPLPVETKQNRNEGKLLLRAAVGDLLPESVLHRTKRGFGSPVEAWLVGPLRGLVEDLLASPDARVRSVMDPRGVDRVLAETRAGTGNAHQAWALLAYESWARG